MAKTINLTVNVDDSQFQKFMRDYTAFSKQVKDLTVNFNAVTKTISKSHQQTKDWLGLLQSVDRGISGLLPGALKLTREFAKWAAVIGGLAMLLGTGAGIGIDRLATTLIQRRRQMMGLGGDWSRIQAVQLGAQATIADPMSAMQNIQRGKLGDVGVRAGLLAAGVSMEDILDPKKGPAEILEQIIRKMPETFKRAGKGL